MDGFEKFIENVKSNPKIELVCPIGCSSYGYLCSGDPYETPCSSSYLVDKETGEPIEEN